jgi:orotidine-5'-phosphate decarboxylase
MRKELLAILEAQPLTLNFLTSGEGIAASKPVRVPPEQLVEEPEVAKQLACELVVRATAPYAAAFKPNAAFFELEMGGGVGIPELVRELGGEQLVIFDGKRGDIGNTSRQYARAIFEQAHFDAATVNPLMGKDAIEPFLQWPERGVFLLCLTSNPGAEDFLLKNDLYLKIAEKAVAWNEYDNVGLVVGATRPEYAARVREVAPTLPFLVPGVGAQGGSLEDILDAIGARENPRFLINASRSIMFPAASGGDVTKMIAEAARSLRDAIQKLVCF